MKIKNFLKGKYWLWGVLFGIIWVGLAGFYRYFTATFPRWDYRYAVFHSVPYAVFFGIISELFFRSLNGFRKHPPNNYLRIIFLVLLILLLLFFLAGIFVSTIWPFAD